MSFGILFGSGAAGVGVNLGCLGTVPFDDDCGCHCIVDCRAGEFGILDLEPPDRPGVPGFVNALLVSGTTSRVDVPCLVYTAMTEAGCFVITLYEIV